MLVDRLNRARASSLQEQKKLSGYFTGIYTSDGMEWTGLGCDVCGYGSVENVEEYDPTKPCPDCGVIMWDGAHPLSEAALKQLEKKLLQFSLKHWDKVPKPIQMLYRVLYGKKKAKPPKAMAALSQRIAQVGFKNATGIGSGVIMMKSYKESLDEGRKPIPAKGWPMDAHKIELRWRKSIQGKESGRFVTNSYYDTDTDEVAIEVEVMRGYDDKVAKKNLLSLVRDLLKGGFQVRKTKGKIGHTEFPVFRVKPKAKSESVMYEQRRLAGLEDIQEPVQEDDNIGRTILHQMGGVGRLRAMTGASQFRLLPKGVGIKFPNKKRSRGNYVEVTLRPDDTYNMVFSNVSVKGVKVVKKYTMVYNDQLISIFENQTGLYLRL